MDAIPNTTPLFRPLDPTELIGPNTFYTIPYGQIIFFNAATQNFVITTIAPENEYTTAQYLTLPEGAPYQLIQQKLIFMPAPSFLHQTILGNIHFEIKYFLKSNPVGIVQLAPTDVVLGENTIVQPDVFFVSINRKAIIDTKVNGAPELVVEILSSNEKLDRETKMELYAENDVVEYWIVHPTQQYIEVYYNQNQQMQLVQKATRTDILVSKAILGFELALSSVFDV